jgi:hypothetical protein
VIERKGSDCKYVEIFTHNIRSIDAPSLRAVFTRGANILIVIIIIIIIIIIIAYCHVSGVCVTYKNGVGIL